MILNSLLSLLDLFNSGTQLMLPKNFSRMVLLALSLRRPNSLAQLLMKMVFATLVVPMVEYIFGIRNKILD
jgi:hypothetical protein